MEIHVQWDENLQLPVCNYCIRGKTCTCAAKDSPKCSFCEEGCDCGYTARIEGAMCECECTCGENEDGNCEDCCVCDYPIEDEVPDQCYCSCECEECTCRCSCPQLVIAAASYNDWVRKTCYVCDPTCLTDDQLNADFFETRCLTPVGSYVFFIRSLPISRTIKQTTFGLPLFLASPSEVYEIQELSRIKVVQNGWKGLVRFDGPVHIPVLAKPEEYDSSKLRVWMSLTPMEVMSQKPGVDLAAGKVLIGGLGLGWLTERVLEKSNVSHVTQIELDPDIIAFSGEPLEKCFADKLTLICDDVWNFINNVDISYFDTILLDIWPGYIESQHDSKLAELRKHHPRVWAWGEEKIKN